MRLKKRVVPECFGDTLMVQVLGFNDTNHQKSIVKVIDTINKKYDGSKVVGIVDDDKRKPIKLLSEYVAVEEKFNCKVYQRKNTESYLIFLCPALERWVWEAARLANVNYKKYGLKSFDSFRTRNKNQFVDKDKDIFQFLLSIKRNDSKHFRYLSNKISQIIN